MPIPALHSLLLLAATTGTYYWLTNPTLNPYTLQLVAALVLAYAFTHWFKSSHRPRLKPRTSIPFDLTLLTITILLLVVETGALTSPLIFLLYFLLFAVALLFEIQATLLLTGTLLTFFLLLPGTNLNDLSHLSELLALVMVTPLALFTAHQYEVILQQQALTTQLNQHLAKEETDTLIFLSTNLKTTLLSALDQLSLLIPQTRLKRLQLSLQTLYQDLKLLYRSADELQQLIDQETD